jgi:hypothetical protein
MRNLIRSAALLVCTGMAFAQSNSAQTSVGQPTDTNEPVYKGCLTGTKNNYTLTTEDGKSYRLHSDKDIDDHLNRRVEVRGSLKKEGGDRSAASTTAFEEIDVADLKSVGKESCVGPTASGNSSADKSASSDASMSASTKAEDKSATTPGDMSASGSTSSTAATATGSASADASSLPQSDKPQTDVGAGTDKNEPLFKGCVTGTKDNYTLEADNGDMYRLHSDKDISEHVGDRVEIRGTLKPEGEKRATAQSKWKGELDVADIKTVEDGACAKK